MNLKNVIRGTRLEAPARKLRAWLGGRHGGAAANAPDYYDAQTFEVMRRVLGPGSTCVDVGCHAGSILREMLRLAPDGRHLAFEPIPEMYPALVAAFPTVRVFDVALSDREGEVAFQHVTSNPCYSGLQKRRYERADETVQEIKVKAKRLDDLVAPDERIDFIKIDVEGAELQVLRGALATIQRTRPVIVFEHGVGAADCYGTTPEQVYDLLSGQGGLSVWLMVDWLRGQPCLTRDGFAAQFYGGLNYYFMAAPA